MRCVKMAFDNDIAELALFEMEAQQPPQKKPESIKSFIEKHAVRINALVERGWPAEEALARIADATGLEVNQRTLVSYLRRSKKSTDALPRKRGRPAKNKQLSIGGHHE